MGLFHFCFSSWPFRQIININNEYTLHILANNKMYLLFVIMFKLKLCSILEYNFVAIPTAIDFLTHFHLTEILFSSLKYSIDFIPSVIIIINIDHISIDQITFRTPGFRVINFRGYHNLFILVKKKVYSYLISLVYTWLT